MPEQIEPVRPPAIQFGNYRLLTVLLTNQDAIFYLAEHIYLNTQAIIKHFQVHLPKADQEQFITEAAAIARLSHPSILRSMEFGVVETTPFLVMPNIVTGTLRQRHPAGSRLPLPMILSYIKPLADALDYSHQQQILHRDIQPTNFWLDHHGNVLLSNFRLTLLSHNSHSQSVTDMLQTVAYMAPEQIQGQAGPASDQYALALIVYEWLCGTLPFSSNDYIELAQQQIKQPPPALSSRLPELSPAIEQVLLKALAKDPAERFPSASIFVEMLEKGSITQSLQSFNKNYKKIMGNVEPATDTRRLGRRRVALSLLGLGGLTLAASGGLLYWQTQQQPAKPVERKKSLPPPAQPRIGTHLFTYNKHSDTVYAVAWSKDGQQIASWSRDQSMRIWNAITHQDIKKYQVVNVLAWSPDWRYLATGRASYFELWELSTSKPVLARETILTGAGGPPDDPANEFFQWSPDGNYIASSSDKVIAWNMTNLTELFTHAPGSISWAPIVNDSPLDLTAFRTPISQLRCKS
ncbi:serine/threonine-protein kinase [Dictyobacter kobayashii]|uniref:mitogen-activated protein kinase kinase n=1 Tax=Dictyobacter kobayashii TaxID=2014872 RepID=A0A402AUT5_9CHLR|nr:serine/threonine-protein kinase [Dictyobacter kobayashii]GCE22854.1 hypothetical protein KDK_66540 [Dictyobacter kobayashii]